MPVSNTPLSPMPLIDVAGTSSELTVRSPTEKDVCLVQEMTSITLTPDDDHNDKDVPIYSHVPS